MGFREWPKNAAVAGGETLGKGRWARVYRAVPVRDGTADARVVDNISKILVVGEFRAKTDGKSTRTRRLYRNDRLR